ncbi:hypothetical protein [Nonomuraea sp. LPB2021202275-12-8]|uniref:hypothetical protein n=1 Tax=Nonomuraea sp. LPB2021202275-12-8 TaxID=3120159 RepID=UPI00300C59B0
MESAVLDSPDPLIGRLRDTGALSQARPSVRRRWWRAGAQRDLLPEAAAGTHKTIAWAA